MSVTPGYRWHIGNTRTGKITRNVDLTDYSWTRYGDGPETLDAGFPLDTGKWPTAEEDIKGGHAFLGVRYIARDASSHWLGAGPIRPYSINDQGVLRFGAAGLLTYYKNRKIIPPSVATGVKVAEAKCNYTGAQLGLIAKRLIQNADAWLGPGANFSPPVVLPTDAELGGAGGQQFRAYPGHELNWIGPALEELAKAIDGPEIQLVPRARTDARKFIEWVMRIGVEANNFELSQNGQPWVFDCRVKKSPVASLSITGDSSKVAHISWAAGQGEAEARPIVNAVGDLTGVGEGEQLLLESEVMTTSGLTDPVALLAYAEADVLANSTSVKTWVAKVDRDGPIHVGLLSPGDRTVFQTKGHPQAPDGDHLLRIASISGDESRFVTLTMEPSQAA